MGSDLSFLEDVGAVCVLEGPCTTVTFRCLLLHLLLLSYGPFGLYVTRSNPGLMDTHLLSGVKVCSTNLFYPLVHCTLNLGTRCKTGLEQWLYW